MPFLKEAIPDIEDRDHRKISKILLEMIHNGIPKEHRKNLSKHIYILNPDGILFNASFSLDRDDYLEEVGVCHNYERYSPKDVVLRLLKEEESVDIIPAIPSQVEQLENIIYLTKWNLVVNQFNSLTEVSWMSFMGTPEKELTVLRYYPGMNYSFERKTG